MVVRADAYLIPILHLASIVVLDFLKNAFLFSQIFLVQLDFWLICITILIFSHHTRSWTVFVIISLGVGGCELVESTALGSNLPRTSDIEGPNAAAYETVPDVTVSLSDLLHVSKLLRPRSVGARFGTSPILFCIIFFLVIFFLWSRLLTTEALEKCEAP